jgi:hypothetical protein
MWFVLLKNNIHISKKRGIDYNWVSEAKSLFIPHVAISV